VAVSCEYGDEPSGSCAKELVISQNSYTERETRQNLLSISNSELCSISTVYVDFYSKLINPVLETEPIN
jgi:hypothetical protein